MQLKAILVAAACATLVVGASNPARAEIVQPSFATERAIANHAATRSAIGDLSARKRVKAKATKKAKPRKKAAKSKRGGGKGHLGHH